MLKGLAESWPIGGPLGWSDGSTPTPLLGSAVQPSSAWEALESRRMTKERGEQMLESHTVRGGGWERLLGLPQMATGGDGDQNTTPEDPRNSRLERAAMVINEGTCIHSLRLVTNDHKPSGLCPLSPLQCLTSTSVSMTMLPSPLAPSLVALI